MKDGHKRIKNILKAVGAIFAAVGLTLLLCGTIPFFNGDTSTFFLNFIGIPLLFIGGVCLQFGFMGEVHKYMAEEHTPIAKDVANEMLDGTREGIVKIAKEIKGENGPVCTACGTVNEPNAKFCDNCGKPLAKICSECGEPNDGNAKYCRKCGRSL